MAAGGSGRPGEADRAAVNTAGAADLPGVTTLVYIYARYHLSHLAGVVNF